VDKQHRLIFFRYHNLKIYPVQIYKLEFFYTLASFDAQAILSANANKKHLLHPISSMDLLYKKNRHFGRFFFLFQKFRNGKSNGDYSPTTNRASTHLSADLIRQISVLTRCFLCSMHSKNSKKFERLNAPQSGRERPN
jgi:hypothetical protein